MAKEVLIGKCLPKAGIICLLLLLFFARATFSVEVYKWVDAEGKVHYGDKPSEMVEEAEVITVEDAAGSVDSGSSDENLKAMRKKLLSDGDERLRNRERARSREEAAAQRNKRVCESAVAQYKKAVEAPGRFYIDLKTGERRTSDEYTRKVSAARVLVQANCQDYPGR